MDPEFWRLVAESVAPALAVLTVGAIPTSILFILKHFKLKTRELELEAELHGREAQARIQALETRQAAVESALQSIASSLQHRSESQSFYEPPPHEELAGSQPRALTSVKPKNP